MRRIGAKSNTTVRNGILSKFPDHDIYLEPFFGGGSIFFNKQPAKYNFLNDLDNNIFDSFDIIVNNKEQLIEYIENVPRSQEVFNYYKTLIPTSKIEKVVQFLILNSYSYLGQCDCFKIGLANNKSMLLKNIEKEYKKLVANENIFTNLDFRRFFKNISFRIKTDKDGNIIENNKNKAFAYLDPPYIETGNNYKENDKPINWKEQDSYDLMLIMRDFGVRMAMSEFDHPFILQTAKEFGFHVHIIGDRQNLKNVRTEILITNYEVVENKNFNNTQATLHNKLLKRKQFV